MHARPSRKYLHVTMAHRPALTDKSSGIIVPTGGEERCCDNLHGKGLGMIRTRRSWREKRENPVIRIAESGGRAG